MQLLDVPVIKYPDFKQPIYWHHFTDIHMGAEGCDERQLDKDIQGVIEGQERGELHLWSIGGDSINGIGPKDKRHDNTSVASRFKQYEGQSLFWRQVEAVAEKFARLKTGGVFVGAGNHETAVSKNGEYDPAEHLAKELNLPYAGYSAAFRIRLDPANWENSVSTVTGYWHHGFGGGRSKGSKANLGSRLQEIINVDIYLTGHVHEPIVMPDEELTVTRRGTLRLIARDKLAIIGASYLKTYPTVLRPQTTGAYDPRLVVQYDYGEVKGYRPAVIGHVGFSMTINRERKIELRAVDFR